MKPLIVYFSHTGNNEKLALKLKNLISCDIHKITETKKRKMITILLDFVFNRKAKLAPYDIPFSNYNNIIFLSPIWAGNISSPLKTFLKKEKANIKKYYFASLCGAAKGQDEKVTKQLTKIIGHEPAKIMELSIERFFTKENQNNVSEALKFCVSDSQLEEFNEEIKEFAQAII